MTFPSFSTYITELVFCAFVIIAVRLVAGRWLGPGARRLLWVLLMLKALVPWTVPTAYHPLGALAMSWDVLTTREAAYERSTGVPPVSRMGVSPMPTVDNSQDSSSGTVATGGTPVGLMGETPMPRSTGVPPVAQEQP